MTIRQCPEYIINILETTTTTTTTGTMTVHLLLLPSFQTPLVLLETRHRIPSRCF